MICPDTPLIVCIFSSKHCASCSRIKMQAVRIHPSTSSTPFSPGNPAPPAALVLDHDVSIPSPEPGYILVRVHAATVTRDELTWPESYVRDFHIPGADFAGVVTAVHQSDATAFAPGDEVFAFDLHRGSTWAEYTTVAVQNLALKPKTLSFEQAATIPISALTAWQALFQHLGFDEPVFDGTSPTAVGRTVFVTGASGAVGTYVVQLAAAAGLHVVAASGSNERNADFLRSVGASETVEYQEIFNSGRTFEKIIDTAGGETLKQCWAIATDKGSIVTIDSANFDFGEKPAPATKEKVQKLFFILEPSGKTLGTIANALDLGLLSPFVACTFPLADARAAYEKASGRLDRRGKVVLTIP